MDKLISLVAEVLQVPVGAVGEETGTATDPAWTSLRHVELVVAVERTYGVTLTAREARTCRSVKALREVLTDKGVRV
jgi:acyl carrier protein